MGRILTPIAVIASLVAFIPEAIGSNGAWVYSLDRGSYVLVALAVVASLLSERRADPIVLGAQLAVAATAIGFMTIAIVRFYGSIAAFGVATGKAYPWGNEALTLGVATLAFGLMLARRRSTLAIAALVVATAATIGCAIYAATQRASYAAELWWWVATLGAFLAAAAAAGLEREGVASGGAPVSGPEVE